MKGMICASISAAMTATRNVIQRLHKEWDLPMTHCDGAIMPQMRAIDYSVIDMLCAA